MYMDEIFATVYDLNCVYEAWCSQIYICLTSYLVLVAATVINRPTLNHRINGLAIC